MEVLLGAFSLSTWFNFNQLRNQITIGSACCYGISTTCAILAKSYCIVFDHPVSSLTMSITRKPKADDKTAEELVLDAWKAGPCGSHDMELKLDKDKFRFHPGRQWRFDIAVPIAKVAIEVEGRGRHQTVVGYRNDCEKYNTATRYGWRVFRFPATDVRRRNEWGEPVLDIFIEQVCESLIGLPPEDNSSVESESPIVSRPSSITPRVIRLHDPKSKRILDSKSVIPRRNGNGLRLRSSR